MRIHIDPHTLERAEERGASEAEIRDVVETGAVCLPNPDGEERQKYTRSRKSVMVDIMNIKGLKLSM